MKSFNWKRAARAFGLFSGAVGFCALCYLCPQAVIVLFGAAGVALVATFFWKWAGLWD